MRFSGVFDGRHFVYGLLLGIPHRLLPFGKSRKNIQQVSAVALITAQHLKFGLKSFLIAFKMSLSVTF